MAEQAWSDMADALNCGIILIGEDERIVLWNLWMAERSGIGSRQAVGAALADLFPETARSRVEQAIRTALRSGLATILSHNLHPCPFPLYNPAPGRCAPADPSGAPIAQSTVIRPIRPTGGPRICLVQVSDVTATVVREKRLRGMADYARSLIEASIDPFITIDRKGMITDCNGAAEAVTGLTRDALIASSFIGHFSQPEQAAAGLDQALAQGVLRDFSLAVRNASGGTTDLLFNISVYRNPAGEIEGILAAGRDMTRQKAIERELNRLATTDALTGVANRRHFMELAEREVLRAHRYRNPLTFLALDVDHFKNINDTHGHAAGDEALRRLVGALRLQLRQSDIIGRLGGEEFLIVLPETPAPDAVATAERLRHAVSQLVIQTSGQPFRMTVSIGVAEHGEAETLQRVLIRADMALYAAKRSGRNRVNLAAVLPTAEGRVLKPSP